MTLPDTTSWTYGEPPPPTPRRDPRVAVLFGCCILVGAALAPIAGWLWAALADPPTVRIASDGGLYLGEQALNQQFPELYYPVGQKVAALMDVAVRTDGKPEALMPAVRQRVHELDADLAREHADQTS